MLNATNLREIMAAMGQGQHNINLTINMDSINLQWKSEGIEHVVSVPHVDDQPDVSAAITAATEGKTEFEGMV